MPIAKAYWLDEKSIGPYDLSYAPRIFKWVLFRKDGQLNLTAMPHGIGLDFHMQLMAETALRKGWCSAGDADRFLRRDGNDFYEAGIEVLGGGARMSNGVVRNYSFRFGAIPAKHLAAVIAALGL